MKWSGLYTALITPFKEGEVDEEGLRLLIQRQKSHGVAGIVLAGTTGEAPTLSAQEKELIIRIGKEEAGPLPLIVGTGSNATNVTIENTQRAADLGADCALVVSPYYNKPTQEGLYQHFKAVAENCPIDLLIYNIPSRTGVNIHTSTLRKIAELPHVVGVKHSSEDLSQAADIVAEIKTAFPHFSLLCGDDAHTLPMMALGADGVVSGGSNLFSQEMLSLVSACQREDFVTARALHYQLLPLFKAASLETNPIPIKAALEMVGLPAGAPRLPLNTLSPQNREKLQEVLCQKELV